MKTFVAFLFIFITIASISCPVNAICDESRSESKISADENVSVIKAVVSCQDNDHADGNHQHGACHNCHLGHCSFTLSSHVILSSTIEFSGFKPAKTDFNLSDFQSSPFRPPIS